MRRVLLILGFGPELLQPEAAALARAAVETLMAVVRPLIAATAYLEWITRP
jgi:hypothetical protein